MARRRPQSISGLVKALGIKVEDLDIKCHFCNKSLSLQDRYSFDVRDHRLIYRGGEPRACCSPCIRAAARHDRDTGNLVPVTIPEIEALEGKNIADIVVLCTLCLKNLDTVEKLVYLRAGFWACWVRDRQYRAVCRMCMVPDGKE
ncbi:E6 [Eidolon helvum papillomavirus 3]|uniref:Protein E6 n=1 Tax=Eidolon helvum papillomavirus 3 TaxID=1335477 RepID=A0A1P8YVT7_9PAPI|nr:E6 [Eidolon helvum papillomavirus 3]AQA28209.1 E6 [Eidolon helvum papillomavirus 3]